MEFNLKKVFNALRSPQSDLPSHHCCVAKCRDTCVPLHAINRHPFIGHKCALSFSLFLIFYFRIPSASDKSFPMRPTSIISISFSSSSSSAYFSSSSSPPSSSSSILSKINNSPSYSASSTSSKCITVNDSKQECLFSTCCTIYDCSANEPHPRNP